MSVFATISTGIQCTLLVAIYGTMGVNGLPAHACIKRYSDVWDTNVKKNKSLYYAYYMSSTIVHTCNTRNAALTPRISDEE